MKKLLPFCFVLLFAFGLQAQKNYRVIIDAGHGGKDPGKPRGSANRLHEKEFNLILAKKVGVYLQKYLNNVEVYYTRTTDEYLSLKERANFANRNKGDIFVSIHANSNPKRHIQGTETHIYSHKLKASKYLAELIQREFATRAGRRSRGVFDARQRGHNLYVTQYTEMPSVLVECGFMSNPTEEAYLNSENGQDIIASAIFRAIRAYLQSVPPREDRSKYYRVQLLASPIALDIKGNTFKKTKEKVVELVVSTGKYRYKYMVGREYDIERARNLAKKMRKAGFKDAFIVKLDGI